VQRALRSAAGLLGVGPSGEKDYIKRVIGVGGDRVACCTNGNVTVQPGGSARPVELVEPYVFTSSEPQPFCEAGSTAEACPPGAPGILVPEGRIFVMGDHRDRSGDSRAYATNADNGTIDVDDVIGRAFLVVWPIDNAAVLRVPQTFDGPAQRPPASAVGHR
jgi:signal peptidase I